MNTKEGMYVHCHACGIYGEIKLESGKVLDCVYCPACGKFITNRLTEGVRRNLLKKEIREELQERMRRVYDKLEEL